MRQVKMTRDSFHVFQANARNALKQSEQVPSILICAGEGGCHRHLRPSLQQVGL